MIGRIRQAMMWNSTVREVIKERVDGWDDLFQKQWNPPRSFIQEME